MLKRRREVKRGLDRRAYDMLYALCFMLYALCLCFMPVLLYSRVFLRVSWPLTQSSGIIS